MAPILLVVVVIAVGNACPERAEAPLHYKQRPRRFGSRRSSLASRFGDPDSLSLREVCLQPQRPALPLPEQYARSRMPATTHYRGYAPHGVPVSAPAVDLYLFESGRTPCEVRRLEVSGDFGQQETDPRVAQRRQAGLGAVDQRHPALAQGSERVDLIGRGE